jgi:hypothetical protein
MNREIPRAKAITLGTRVQLKGQDFNDIEFRDWEFSGVEKGKIILSRPEGLTLKVRLEDIDWFSIA